MTKVDELPVDSLSFEESINTLKNFKKTSNLVFITEK